MFKATRWLAASVFLLSMIGTFLCAFLLKNALLCIICVIIQALALMWYGLSYIPFARQLVSGFVTRTCGDCAA